MVTHHFPLYYSRNCFHKFYPYLLLILFTLPQLFQNWGTIITSKISILTNKSRIRTCRPHLGPLPVDCAQLENLKRTHSPTLCLGSPNLDRQRRQSPAVASLPANNVLPIQASLAGQDVWKGSISWECRPRMDSSRNETFSAEFSPSNYIQKRAWNSGLISLT